MPQAVPLRCSPTSKDSWRIPAGHPTVRPSRSSSRKTPPAPPAPSLPKPPKPAKSKTPSIEQRLALIDVAGGEPAAAGKLTQITPADTYIYGYDWSPDGKRFVLSSAPGNGDNNWWIAELSTLDAATGRMKSVYKPKLQIANPVWSPDGKRIAFIEGIMSDEGLTGGDIFTIGSDGGEAKNLTKDMKASAAWLAWQP